MSYFKSETATEKIFFLNKTDASMASKSKQPKRAAGQNANYTGTRLVFTLYVVKMRQ